MYVGCEIALVRGGHNAVRRWKIEIDLGWFSANV
jgi:hypothetical protein